MAMPSHPAAMTAPIQAAHVSIHAGTAIRPVTHTVAGGMHGVAIRTGARSVAATGTVRIRTTHPTTSGRYNPTPFQGPTPEDSYETPGLGFDYAHFAAVHPYFGRRRDHFGSVVPFFGGGIYLPATGYIDSEATADSEDDQAANVAAQPSDMAESAALDQAPMVPRTRSNSNNSVPATSGIYFRAARWNRVFRSGIFMGEREFAIRHTGRCEKIGGDEHFGPGRNSAV